MLILPGSNALSAFRSQRLLTQLQSVAPTIAAVQARFYHFIDAARPLSTEDTGRLSAMLTYGEPVPETQYEGVTEEYFVIPRLGTISPWASKATDIAHNCGMAHMSTASSAAWPLPWCSRAASSAPALAPRKSWARKKPRLWQACCTTA
jgi:phosphoribosylformylglycinamidine synthase